jgi:hypothetical protein
VCTDILSLEQSAARAYARYIAHIYAEKIPQGNINTLATVVTAVKTIIDTASFADVQGNTMGWYHMIFELAYGDQFWSHFDTYKYASVYDQIVARKDILEAALGNKCINDLLGGMYKKTLIVGYRYLYQLAESLKDGTITVLGSEFNGIKLRMPKIYQGRKRYVQCSLMAYVCTHLAHYTFNEKIDSNENIPMLVYDEFLSMLSTFHSKNVLDKISIFNSCDSSMTENNTEESSVYVLEYLLRQADLDKDLMVYYYERAYWLMAHGWRFEFSTCYYYTYIDAGKIPLITFLKNIFINSTSDTYIVIVESQVMLLEAAMALEEMRLNLGGDNINIESYLNNANHMVEKLDEFNNMYALILEIQEDPHLCTHLSDLFKRMESLI